MNTTTQYVREAREAAAGALIDVARVIPEENPYREALKALGDGIEALAGACEQLAQDVKTLSYCKADA